MRFVLPWRKNKKDVHVFLKGLNKTSLYGLSSLLLLVLLSSLVVWKWGNRFSSEPLSTQHSIFESHYLVEGVQAEIYDTPATGNASNGQLALPRRHLHFSAQRLLAMDEAGSRWLVEVPIFTGIEDNGKQVTVKSPTAQWDNHKQQGYFPSQVEVIYQQPGQPEARLKTRELIWKTKERIIMTEQPFSLVYGSQILQAKGLYWDLAAGRVQLKAHLHWQDTSPPR
ncbi:MAG: LPS export ABC transporter periplasmic protein LptC [Pseudomonadota bacterium]